MPQNPASSRKQLLLFLVLIIALLSLVMALSLQNTVARASTVVSQPEAVIDGGDMLLVWLGTGAKPGQHSPTEPGQLVLMDSTGGNIQPLLDLPQQTTRVIPCGENATSPDNRRFAFFVGHEQGTLYMMTGADTLNPVASDVSALACMGQKTFRYSPDSKRFGYLAFVPDATSKEFAEGWLHIADTESQTDVTSFPGVTAFDMTNDQMVFVRFFTTDAGEADEAGVFVWNGTSDQEVATIYPEENCRFTSAQIGVLPDSKLVLVAGHRCKSGDTRTSWQFYTVDTASRSATLSMSDFQVSPFVPFAQTNNVILSPDHETAYFTVPDGITASTVALVAVDLANISSDNVIIPANAVMPRYDAQPYNFATNAPPMISRDGRWLALVTNTANSEATLTILDLNDPAVTPIEVPAGGRGDTISEMLFTPDNKQLVFVSGSDGGGENALLSVNLETGDDARVKRGRYGWGVMAPDNNTLAMMEWRQIEDPKEPLFLTLVLIDVASGAGTPIYEGADVVEGKVTNQRFAYPLTWRRN